MNYLTNPNIRLGFLLSTLTFFGGCSLEAGEVNETIAEHSAALSRPNAVTINGDGTNGDGTNGDGTNGDGTNGDGTNGDGTNGDGTNGDGTNGSRFNLVGRAFELNTISNITFHGASVQPAALYKAAIKAALSGGAVASGSALLGMEVTGKLDNGSTVTLRLDSMEHFTSATGDSLARFVISYTRPGSTLRSYVCGKNNGAPIKTIPVTGRWNYSEGTPDGGSKTEDPSAITFACQGFALYKCIDYGYPPWKHENGVSLHNHHQACVRMIRADYCGDGHSWTVDGTYINLYDNLGIQADTESWSMEAEWDIEGARCLSHQRIQNMSSAPTCSFARSPSACGNPPEWGPTLLVSEAL